MICGNGIWLQNNDYSTSEINAICDEFVKKNINLIYYAAGMWSDNILGRLGRRGESNVRNAVNAVHAYNASHGTNIKILGFIMFPGFGSPEDVSNYQERINDLVSLCQDTGLDGINDDIEEFVSRQTAQQQLNYYNGATAALHAMNPSRLMTYARTIGNNQAPYFDNIVYPGLVVDILIPMFYNGRDTGDLTNEYWNQFFAPGYVQSPLSIGIRPDLSSMNSIISAINAKTNNGQNRPSNLAGYSIWSYDAGNMVPSQADWTAWTNWTGKNFAGCGDGPIICKIPTCNLRIML